MQTFKRPLALCLHLFAALQLHVEAGAIDLPGEEVLGILRCNSLKTCLNQRRVLPTPLALRTNLTNRTQHVISLVFQANLWLAFNTFVWTFLPVRRKQTTACISLCETFGFASKGTRPRFSSNKFCNRPSSFRRSAAVVYACLSATSSIRATNSKAAGRISCYAGQYRRLLTSHRCCSGNSQAGIKYHSKRVQRLLRIS